MSQPADMRPAWITEPVWICAVGPAFSRKRSIIHAPASSTADRATRSKSWGSTFGHCSTAPLPTRARPDGARPAGASQAVPRYRRGDRCAPLPPACGPQSQRCCSWAARMCSLRAVHRRSRRSGCRDRAARLRRGTPLPASHRSCGRSAAPEGSVLRTLRSAPSPEPIGAQMGDSECRRAGFAAGGRAGGACRGGRVERTSRAHDDRRRRPAAAAGSSQE
jgi:hypothetical protein